MTVLTIQPDESTGLDTYVSSYNPTFNYGIATTLRMGAVGGSGGHTIFIKFDLSGIPVGATITSAILSLYCTAETVSTDFSFTCRRALEAFFEGAKNGAAPDGGQDGSNYTYRNANGSVAWTGANGGSSSNGSATDMATATVTGTGAYFDWDVTEIVKDFYDGTYTNHGFGMGYNIGTDADKTFASSGGSAGQRPKLVVTYTTPGSPISGTSDGMATVSGTLAGHGLMSGTSAGAATVSGHLTDELISGTSAGAATVSGTLTARAFAAGVSAGSATVTGHLIGYAPIQGLAAGQATVIGSVIPVARASGLAAGQATVIGRLWGKAVSVVRDYVRNPAPLLELTDGVDTFNLLDPRAYSLCAWRPAIAQLKNGGQWSDSPLAHGRRLVLRRFANAVEVMEFSASGKDQDELIAYTRELLRWLEAAAGYWTSRWATRPVYLRARSAYEKHIRHGIVHVASVPELEDVYAQSFFTARGRPSFDKITLRLERGPWLDMPPGTGTCVAVSSLRSWTVAGWESSDTGGGGGGGDTVSGDVLAMIEANNGDILIGVNDSATIYRSSDEGQSWIEVISLGSSSDSVNAFSKEMYTGILYAAVSGSASAQGIWRSTNNGANWTRVKSHPDNLGYLDVTNIQGGSRVVAVGHAVTSSLESPIIYSDNGISWSNFSTGYYNQPHMSVAAYRDPVLFSQYPGEPFGSPEAFYGTDTFYTATGRVGIASSGPFNNALGTVGGGAGNGGLDMAAFLFKDSSGQYRRRALWAVKSHLNTANTEIWQWPSSPTGPYSFAKIATITGELFTALYVDTTPDYTSAQRTIWAGANGKIFVSYNSGLAWALATDAPTNPVRCFLRTASGVMLAGCDNAEIFLFSGSTGSEGGGGGGDGGEVAEGGQIVNAQPLGREATCEDEVYVSNKSSFTNITHVLYYDGSTYGELQFATDPPYTLLGDPPASGDALYFGVKTTDDNVPSGTFSSLVFDLSQISDDITIVWEFWSGAAWSTLTVQDGTSAFRLLGVGSVHWAIPSNWATTAVNSITGYWVRARVSAVGSSPVGPIHANRYIYTANLPYVEIAESEIGGEMPALAQVLWSNRSDNPAGSPDMETHRLMVGLRSYERGPQFDAYLNLSDKQVPFGVTVSDLSSAGGFEDSKLAPTARAYSVSYSSGGDLNAWADLVGISLSTTIARDYYGDFRVFLRGYITPGDADDWKFRLALGVGSGGMRTYTREVFGKPAQVNFRLFDMGSVHIPNATLAANHVSDELSITVQGYATATNVAAKLYDLILLPVDEWAGDFVHSNLADANIPSGVAGSNTLDIDSIGNPKSPIAAYNRLESGLIKALYQPIANGEAILQVKQRQRLWFLAAQYSYASNSWGADPYITGTVRVNKVQQYLGLRGAG